MGIAQDNTKKPKACRSVHLQFKSPESNYFFNQVTVRQSSPGTYFCVCGWNKGYYGIQELGNRKKLLIFSVWDSNEDNPNATPKEKRVQVLYKDEKVRTGRFGYEGSGGQSFYDYDWKLNETYSFMVGAKANGERTEYSGYFLVPETNQWKHLITFSTITKANEKKLRGYYSFIEDFLRNGVSETKVRRAEFGIPWLKNSENKWIPAKTAIFTADGSTNLNIDAGDLKATQEKVETERFYLQTGGDTINKHTKLNQAIHLTKSEKITPPRNLPATDQLK